MTTAILRSCAVTILTLALVGISAQTPPKGFGSITGHVYCADTNAPARLAKVLLRSVTKKSQTSSNNSVSLPGTTTGFDGAFRIDHVPVGEYSIYAVLPGYLDESNLPPAIKPEDSDATEESQTPRKIATVQITENVVAMTELRIERAGTLSGTIRYEDGTPVPNGTVTVLSGWNDGEPRSKLPETINLTSPFLFDRVGTVTDDYGRFRISGLPAGRYSLKVTLAAPKHFSYQSKFQSVTYTGDQMSTAVFLGDTLHWSDARAATLGSGEEKTGMDITVPLQGFHTIAGVVEAKLDGHRVNAGIVRLEAADDPAFNRTANIQQDGSFEFDFVPTGTYSAEVKDATDSKGRLAQAEGRTIFVVDTLQKFGPAKVPVVLQTTDVTNVVLAVSPVKTPKD
jgi:hypothetical protein